ncbi:hypothetical protein [Haloarcula marina]|uniref:hypothetical protein n=1 Tax=Haloarcula marina TaxID=2961574 RepID=UPI0020B6F44E|nr:hypothetical protein [Halomicroarcula marina]
MSIAIAHFAVGATATTVLVALLGPRVPFPRTVVLAGGGWALLPDAHQIAPFARETLYDFHDSAAADVFWFHRTLDVVDGGDSLLVAALCLSGLVLTTLLAELWGYWWPTVAPRRQRAEADRSD